MAKHEDEIKRMLREGAESMATKIHSPVPEEGLFSWCMREFWANEANQSSDRKSIAIGGMEQCQQRSDKSRHEKTRKMLGLGRREEHQFRDCLGPLKKLPNPCFFFVWWGWSLLCHQHLAGQEEETGR